MNSKKILFTASIPLHFRAFHLPYLEWFKGQGFEVHVACKGYEELPFVDKYWDVPIERSPFSVKNLLAYKELRKIIDKENFTLVNCHTPMASVITRLASINARKNGMSLLYTAHGFHFFKGAPVFNWMFYYPMEILLSGYTDSIICINQEDFELIKKRGSKKCYYSLIPGIGVNSKRFYPISEDVKIILREKNDLQQNDFLLIYAAEFINRKNHEFIINSVKNNQKSFEGIKILFAGKGVLEEKLKRLVEKHKLDNYFCFVGFRKDIDLIYKMSDLGISSSKQEGLGLNLVEEMMCGLPIIATVDRGHKEVIDHNVNGYLFEQNNEEQFLKYILALKSDNKLRENMSQKALLKAKKFEISNSLKVMTDIYREYI